MKRAPDLDFSRSRAARQHWKHAVLGILGLVFGLQMGVAAWRYQSLESARSAFDSQYRHLTGKSARTDRPDLTPEQIKAAAAAQTMLNGLGVPWEELLSAIEAASTKRVVVDAIQPRAEDGSMNISVSSAEFASVADFIRRLAQQELLHDVMLVSETLPENGGSSLRAVISANWRQSK